MTLGIAQAQLSLRFGIHRVLGQAALARAGAVPEAYVSAVIRSAIVGARDHSPISIREEYWPVETSDVVDDPGCDHEDCGTDGNTGKSKACDPLDRANS
jgi:hypothetical protein